MQLQEGDVASHCRTAASYSEISNQQAKKGPRIFATVPGYAPLRNLTLPG